MLALLKKWRYFYDYDLTGKGYRRDSDRAYRIASNMREDARKPFDKKHYSEHTKEDFDRYYETYDRTQAIDERAREYSNKAYNAILPTAERKARNAIWDLENTIENIPHNVVDKGRMITSKLLAGKASDYLVNDILSKTDAKQVTSGNYVYRSNPTGLTRMTKKEARLRQDLGNELYENLYK